MESRYSILCSSCFKIFKCFFSLFLAYCWTKTIMDIMNEMKLLSLERWALLNGCVHILHFHFHAIFVLELAFFFQLSVAELLRNGMNNPNPKELYLSGWILLLNHNDQRTIVKIILCLLKRFIALKWPTLHCFSQLCSRRLQNQLNKLQLLV